MKRIFLLVLTVLFQHVFSQEKILKRYDNGNIQYEGFVVNNTLDSIYKEYYDNGVLKEEGCYKNCDYKFNNRSVLRLGCGVGSKKDSINFGKRIGEWKNYYENGKLKSSTNYFCGIEQGSFFYYYENGAISTIDFYDAGDLNISQEYNENKTLEEIIYYDKKFIKGKRYKNTRKFEFYEKGNFKSETIVEEKEDGYEHKSYKEYYPNGFLKTEQILIDGNKHGACYEYYENGNVKHTGCFEYDKPVFVQLFYNEDGTPNKLERWEKGKLILTENNFDPKKSFKYKVKAYKD
jgi:antitoxin component YwqK of YwqJK toxin-antitoxin module